MFLNSPTTWIEAAVEKIHYLQIQGFVGCDFSTLKMVNISVTDESSK